MLPPCFGRDQPEGSRLFENCKKWHNRQTDSPSKLRQAADRAIYGDR